MKNKSYNQYCGLAYALEVVGERWTLLVVRELIAGPRRFKDLISGLPGVSTNLLSERLRSLEHQKMIQRRVLPPPSGSTVYELTPLGRTLEPTLLELGRWGSQFIPASHEGVSVLRVGSYALTFKTFFRPELADDIDETYQLNIDGEMMQVHIDHGTIAVEQGEPHKSDVVFHSDVTTMLGMLQGMIDPQRALAEGILRIDGDQDAIYRLLRVCGVAEIMQDDDQAAPVI